VGASGPEDTTSGPEPPAPRAMILIISFPDSDHVERVRQHLRMPSMVVDTSWFPVALGLEARLAAGTEGLRFALPDGERLDLADVGAVWYRRPRSLELHQDLVDGTARRFAWSESNEALLGVWYALECFWMNHPIADEVAQRKIRQLQAARRIGLSVPETLVTNQPAAAEDFVARHGPGRVIRKAFRNIAEAPRETTLVRQEDLAVIDAVRYAPVIFQRYVAADADLRVTVVEDDVFAAAIRSTADHQTDYRLGLASATVTPYRLPHDVTARLLELMKVLELSFGAIDMRLTPEGEHVFLEVNPAGEFLFVSERTGQPIPAAIAACLQRHDQVGR
jgi:glutathione synthase/RimK-type ligase-like ATP-grasp enzyme